MKTVPSLVAVVPGVEDRMRLMLGFLTPMMSGKQLPTMKHLSLSEMSNSAESASITSKIQANAPHAVTTSTAMKSLMTTMTIRTTVSHVIGTLGVSVTSVVENTHREEVLINYYNFL